MTASTKNSMSSITTARLEAEANIAVLLVRKAALVQKHALEEEIRIIKRKKEELEIKIKIAEAKAKLTVLTSAKVSKKTASHKVKVTSEEVTVGLSLDQNVVASLTLVTTSPVTPDEDTGAGVDNNHFTIHTETTSHTCEYITHVPSSPRQEQTNLILKDAEHSSKIMEPSEAANSEGIGPNTVDSPLVQGFGAPLRSTGQGRTGLPDDDLTVAAVENLTEDGGSRKHLKFEIKTKGDLDTALSDVTAHLFILDNSSWPMNNMDKPQALFFLKLPRAFKRKRWKV